MTKKSRKKKISLERKKLLRWLFKGLSIVKYCFRPESAPLNWQLILGQNLPKKDISGQKQKKWTLHIRISVGNNFQLKPTILIISIPTTTKTKFRPNLLKKSISDLNRENGTTRLNSAYSNYCTYQLSAQTNNFYFLVQICPKMIFPVSRRKCEHNYRILNNRISLRTKFLLIS